MALLVDLPDRIDLLLARGLGLANKHVPRLLCAAGDLQELVKLQHPSLAARPPFATLVEHWVAWVVCAFLLIPRSRSSISSTASFATAGRVGRDLQIRIIRIGLRQRGSGRRGRRDGGGEGCPLGQLGLNGGSLLGGRLCDLGRLGSRCVVDSRMLPGGAWWDGEELLKGQDAGLAAFPAWGG